jgi:Na+/H+ antiporter
MSAVALVLVLLAATAVLRFISDRLEIPHAAVLVLGGLVLAVTPGLPRATLDPDVVFLVFVPPLLYSAAIHTSWRDFRLSLRPILLLGVALVSVTIVAVAIAAHRFMGLPWAPAFVLGAIVSPPDGVAATAVTRRLNVTSSVRTLLRGEGLVNDATAFVAYRMAVRAASSGEFSFGAAVLQFVAAGAGGIAIGLAVGYSVVALRRRLPPLPEAENTISLLTPFAAFIPAEHFGLSSVLAVVAAGLYVSREAPRFISPETRVQLIDMWAIVTFVLEGLIFILIGLDLPLVLKTVEGRTLTTLIWYGLAASATVIAVRMAWTFPAAYIRQTLEKWLNSQTVFFTMRELFFIAWAGMRGADSLVIALALPLAVPDGRAFPGRGIIIFVTFTVILVTLVLQGLSLPFVIRRLGLHDDGREDEESTEARLRTAEAGLATVDAIIAREPALAKVASQIRERHRHRVHRYAGRRRHQIHQRDESAAADYRKVRGEMIDAERRELIRLRDEGVVGDHVMHAIERELDLEQIQLDAEEPGEAE